MWKLVIEDDEGKRTLVPLTRDLYSIGRREGNVIRLTERNVSREHARLCKKASTRPGRGAESGFVVEDLTSYNGVYVNGLRITHGHELAHGDLVQIGDYRIVLQNEAATVEAEPSGADWKQTIPSAPQARVPGLLDRPNRFVMLAGPTPGAEFPLSGERLTIGRAEEADVSVNHNSVSRMHCEVHAIGDGRFEIVDQGSSNGVRVNGADLRRGIIEPGDLIELGDVRLKFVGAGQIFRPSEGQPFAAIADRDVPAVARRRIAGTNALPLAVFVSVVLAGGVGAWMYTRPHVGAAITAAAPSFEQATLAEAKRLCAAGDCEAAHAKLDIIPAASRWRDTADFRDIESRWAESVIARADAVADPVARRELYRRVSQTVAVDAPHRKTAADRLQQLDVDPMPAATNAMELPVASAAPSASSSATARSRPDDAGVAPAREVTRRVAAGIPDAGAGSNAAPSRAAEATTASVDERERQLALRDTPEAKLVLKQQLEPRVYGGKASDAEIRLLISTCKDLGDRTCVQQARSILAQKSQ